MEPNAFPSIGMSCPLTFSNSMAGPLQYISLRMISATSKSASTSASILFSSPCLSSSEMSPRTSFIGM